MNNIYNAVSDCMEDLEYQGHFTTYIQQVRDNLYHVRFEECRNRNNEFTIEVEYCTGIDLTRNTVLEDGAWDEFLRIEIINRHRVSRATAELIYENLAFHIDADYFDSDSEDESEDDDETLSIGSQPLTPPPSRARRG